MNEQIHNQPLNRKQRLFVEAYFGDVVEAARIAGYVGTNQSLSVQGNKLLNTPHIMEAIKDRSKYQNKKTNVIASREERQAMWSSIMNNDDPDRITEKDANGIDIPKTNIPMNMRLKASELLGKSEGDFVERVDITANLSISDVMLESYKIEDKSIEAIEAEYMEVRRRKKLEQAEIEEAEYDDELSTEDKIEQASEEMFKIEDLI